MEEPEILKIYCQTWEVTYVMLKSETLQVLENDLRKSTIWKLINYIAGHKKLPISGSESIQQEEPKRKTENKLMYSNI